MEKKTKRALVVIGTLIAWLAFVVGCAYVAIWLGFVGGAVDILEGAKTNPVAAWDIAVGLFKFFVLPTLCVWVGTFGTIFSGAIVSEMQ